MEKCEIDLSHHCLYVQCIRRANLDAMNARARDTVRSHVDFVRDAAERAKQINRIPYFKERGPFPIGDVVGMGLAVDMLLKSLMAKGRIQKSIQFETMQKCRGTYTLTWKLSPSGVMEGGAFTSGRNRIQMTMCPTQSASLRGHEGFYLDIAATRVRLHRGRNGVIPQKALSKKIMTKDEALNLPYVCFCLLGKLKGETGERYHSVVLANQSSSGLKTRWWVEQVLEVCEAEGRRSDGVFNNADGSPPIPSEYNTMVRHYFQMIQEEPQTLLWMRTSS